MKTILSALLIAFIGLTSCLNGLSAKEEQNKKLIEELFRHFNDHDWKAYSAIYADKALFLDPSLGQVPVSQTKEQIESKYQNLQTVFPDIRDEIVHLYTSGDKHVIVEFVSTGTSGDGSKFSLPICTIFTIENGKIVDDFTYYDN